LTGYNNVTAENVTLQPNVTVNPKKTVDDLPGHMAPSASSSGIVEVYIVLPKPYTYNHDGERWDFLPSNGCNLEHYKAAFDSLRSQFPKPSSSTRLSAHRYCILQSPYRWDPCLSNGYYGSLQCTRDIDTLLERFKAFTGTWRFAGMRDGANELLSAVVSKSTNNGIGDQPGRYSILSERTTWRPESPNTSILVHEFGHNFGASHYPANDVRKFTCRWWHQHSWFYGHLHESDSVMNYCYMYWGYNYFDYDNRLTVSANLWP
ncbi:MAG: zinc-dependent metalloprotease, partial [Halobacteriales archaeon]|nr:zinc-dependent metalloprotease [Halobacteriales archaeon]